MTRKATTMHLPGARDQLHNAIAALIDPRPTTHDGQTRWQASIWAELHDAITTGGSGSSRAAPASRPPCWLDAIDLESDISRQARRWVRRGGGPEHPTVNRLRYLTAHRWRPQDVQLIAAITGQIQAWTARYAAMVDARPKSLPSPCPACGAAHVYRWVDGERVRSAALTVTTTECRCHHCGAVWQPSQFALLARVLGYRAPEGVAL